MKLQVSNWKHQNLFFEHGLPTTLEAKQSCPNGVGPFQFCGMEMVARHTLKHQMGYYKWDFSL